MIKKNTILNKLAPALTSSLVCMNCMSLLILNRRPNFNAPNRESLPASLPLIASYMQSIGIVEKKSNMKLPVTQWNAIYFILNISSLKSSMNVVWKHIIISSMNKKSINNPPITNPVFFNIGGSNEISTGIQKQLQITQNIIKMSHFYFISLSNLRVFLDIFFLSVGSTMFLKSESYYYFSFLFFILLIVLLLLPSLKVYYSESY